MENTNWDNLTPVQRGLLLDAKEVLDRAYKPYSDFSVAAALFTTDNKTFVGVNIENAAYSPGICAERAAIAHAISAGGGRKYKAIAIIARPGNSLTTEKVTAPCGVCRQVLFEFSQVSEIDIEIILATTDLKKIIITTINELFPMGFGPDDLK